MRRNDFKYVISVFIQLSFLLGINAQVGIGTNNPRGALDINESTTNTNTHGLVLPTNSDPAAIVNPQDDGKPVPGTVMYDSTRDCIKYYKLSDEWSGCLLEETVLGDSSGSLNGEGSSCGLIMVNGSYSENEGLSLLNTVEVQVDIATPGTYTITTDEVNGYSFEGEGTFGSVGTHTAVLVGTGTPIASGLDTFTVMYDGGTCTFDVNVASNTSEGALQGASGSCLGSSVQGTYTTSTALVSGNTISVTVDVTSIGSYNIYTNEVNGYSFSASGTFGSTGSQVVILNNDEGTPQSSGVDRFTITYDESASGTCTVDVTVVDPVATIETLDCSSSVLTGSLEEGTAASGVSVSIPYTGGNGGVYNAINVSSTGVTGLTASASSGAVVVGNGNLVLDITGTATGPGNALFLIDLGGKQCTLEVFVEPVLTVGTFDTPAQSCQAIFDVENTSTELFFDDGEYWIGSGGTKYLTQCDMVSATEAATQGKKVGGYTLVYSISEKVNLETFNLGGANEFSQLLDQVDWNYDNAAVTPRGIVSTEGGEGTVNYNNFRIPYSESQRLGANRITRMNYTSDPAIQVIDTDLTAKDYLVESTAAVSFVDGIDTLPSGVNFEGTFKGYDFRMEGRGTTSVALYLGGVLIDNTAIIYGNDNYGWHLDVNAAWNAESISINNMWGFYGELQHDGYEPYGKCVSPTSLSINGFTAPGCNGNTAGAKTYHADVNGGEGYVRQWWVK